MKRSSLLYYEKTNGTIIFDTLYRLNNMNEEVFKKSLNIRKNKYGKYEANITLKNLEKSFSIKEVA
jgi:hypothetical protein